MERVVVRRADYEPGSLGGRVDEMLDVAGEGVDWDGRRVLVKPNLLLPARTERAVLTHPLVVRAVVEAVRRRGGRPFIGDSPATGTMDRIWRVGGYGRVLDDLRVPVAAFDETVPVDIGPPFGVVPMARAAVEADRVVNLAKLKTHSQMRLTLAVKNMFGCIVGFAKPEWHLRAGVDHALFARLLVQVCRALRPTVSLVDGILAMEGDGPGKAGRPRALGVLLAGADPHAVDLAVCRMLGGAPEAIPTLAAAGELDLLPRRVEIVGQMPPVDRFDIPDPGSLSFGPGPLQRLLRAHTVRKPVVDARRCRQCAECWQYCPAGAISPAPPGLDFDYAACIRCFCCVEVCPHGALGTHDPPAGRLLRRLQRRRGRR